MTRFDPRRGPVFRGEPDPDEVEAAADEQRRKDQALGLGFAVGALGGDVADAAVLRYAVEGSRRSWLSRLRRR